MAHRTEGANYTVYNTTKRIHKDSAPGTTILANSLNMTQEEICIAVEAAGLTLRSTGAADASAVWGQLLLAIKRLAGKPSVANIVMNADGFTFAVTADVTVFKITESGGPFGNGKLYPARDNQTYDVGRTIFVLNGSTTNKLVGDSASNSGALIRPGEIIMFYGILKNDGSTDYTFWQPVGHDHENLNVGLVSQTIAAYSAATALEKSAFASLYFQSSANGRLMTITVSFMQITLTTLTDTIYLADYYSGPLYSFLCENPDLVNGSNFTIQGSLNGTPILLNAVWDLSGSTHVIKIQKQGAGNFPAGGIVNIYGFTITYMVKPQ